MKKKVFHTQHITVIQLCNTRLPTWVWIIRDENGIGLAQSISVYHSKTKAEQAAKYYDKKFNFNFIRITWECSKKV